MQRTVCGLSRRRLPPAVALATALVSGLPADFRASTRRWCWSIANLLLLVAGLCWWGVMGAVPVEAHGELVRSRPGANAVVATAPQAVQLWFSEMPEPSFSHIAVYTSAGERLSVGAPEAAPEDPASLVVRLPSLQPGSYTVAWRALSAADGHASAGVFAFAVGTGQRVRPLVGGALPELGETTQATLAGTTGRWLSYLALVGLLGAVAFYPLILHPALVLLRQTDLGAVGPADPRPPRSTAGQHLGDEAANGGRAARPVEVRLVFWTDAVHLAMTRQLLRFVWLSFVVLAAATAADAVVQASRVAGVPVRGALSLSPDAPLTILLLNTRYGQVSLGRVVLLVSLAVVLSNLRATRQPPGQRTQLRWWGATAVVALVLLTTSLTSHAAAFSSSTVLGAPFLPVAADWVHLIAAALWIGGMIHLLLLLPAGISAAGRRQRLALLQALVASFSRLALTCVAALAVTGLYQAWLQVGTWAALTGTPYGSALGVKLTLVVVLVLLGGFNLGWMGPRLARAVLGNSDGARLIGTFCVAVGTEVCLGSAVLLAAGVLSVSPTAKDAWANLQRGATLEQAAGDLRLRLHVSPATPGLNSFTVFVRDAQGRPVSHGAVVTLVVPEVPLVQMPDGMLHHGGEADGGGEPDVWSGGDQLDGSAGEVTLEPEGGGAYHVESNLDPATGASSGWHGEVRIRRQGRQDVRARFELPLAAEATMQMRGDATAAVRTSAAPLIIR